MKIIVYNSIDQYALSRNQIELIKSILPKEYFTPVKEFHITRNSMGQEKFEYNYETKTVYFEYPVKQKTEESTKDAIQTLLIGLERLKTKAKFGHYIKDTEMLEYLPFAEKWLPICLNKIYTKI